MRVPIVTGRMKPPLLQKCEVWFLKIILRKCLDRHFLEACNLHLWFPHHSFPWFSYFLHFFSIKSLHGYILTISWNMDKRKWKKERKERRNTRKKERKGWGREALYSGGGRRGGETCRSAWPVLTKHHGLGGSQRTNIHFSQFWRLEVSDKGASTVGF